MVWAKQNLKRRTRKAKRQPTLDIEETGTGTGTARSKSMLVKDSNPSSTSRAAPVAAPPPPANNNVGRCASNSRAVVVKWICRTLDTKVQGLAEEFLSLKRYAPPNMTTQAFEANYEFGRSRYKDVPCQDQHRVVLKWPGDKNDFIHANYVATPISEKRFICTQGPSDNTVVDFWHMVIQEESENIIMLCNIREQNVPKCAAYWPDVPGDTKVYGDIEVINMGLVDVEDTSIVRFDLTLKWTENGKPKAFGVRHYHWVDWPDHGVPPISFTATSLLSRVRGSKKPIIVHCSAGIGRTGSIVAIEFILERLQAGKDCEAMDAILKALRNYRPYSIQNEAQYIYVHRILLFYLLEKYRTGTDDMRAKYNQFIIDYEKLVESRNK